MDGALDLAVGAGQAGARGGIQRAVQRDHALAVLLHALAPDDADAAQAHFAAGHEAVEALHRHLHEILALDPCFVGEMHLARAEAFVLGVVREREHLRVRRIEVVDHQLDRIDHRHAPRRLRIQVLADAAFEDRVVGERIDLR